MTSFAESARQLQSAGADPKLVAAAYSGQALSLFALDRFNEAAPVCRAALVADRERGQQSISALSLLADTLVRIGQIDEALLRAEEARRLSAQASSGRAQVGGWIDTRPWTSIASEASVKLAAAQSYRDPASWRRAVRAFERAHKVCGDEIRPDEIEMYGAMVLGEGYAREGIGDYQGAARAFAQVEGRLPYDSAIRIAADGADDHLTLVRSTQLPRLLPHVVSVCAVLIVAAATFLEATGRVESVPWTAIVVGFAFLAIASWYLPVIRTLRIGAAEFTKDTALRDVAPLPRLGLSPIIITPDPADFFEVRGGMGQVWTDSSGPEWEQWWQTMGAITEGVSMAIDLEETIRTLRHVPNHAEALRVLRLSMIFTLGQPAGVVADGGGTESDLLHFTIDDPKTETEVTMLPVFSRPDQMREALLRNPEWQTLSVLEVQGAGLVRNVDHDVRIVINPWSEDLEYQIPSKDEFQWPAEPND